MYSAMKQKARFYHLFVSIENKKQIQRHSKEINSNK
jgi:hypothetical protein